MSDPGKKENRRSGWIVVGFVVTVAYLGFIAWLLLSSTWVTRSQLPTANEWGDLLAGAFARLAFLWLLIAVMVQAQELRLQRTELTLTREEFAASREVATAQAAEARKQAEFIGQQTEMLRASEAQSRRVMASEEARMLAYLLHTNVKEMNPSLAANMFPQTAAEFGRVRQLREWFEIRRDISKKAISSLFTVRHLFYIISVAQQLVELMPKATGPVQLALADASPLQLQQVVQSILDRMQGPDEPADETSDDY